MVWSMILCHLCEGVVSIVIATLLGFSIRGLCYVIHFTLQKKDKTPPKKWIFVCSSVHLPYWQLWKVLFCEVMMMIAFKGAVRDFFKISSLRRELSPTCTLKWPRRYRVQITCNTLSTYHVQRVMCHIVRRDSSAIKFYRVEIAGGGNRSTRRKPLTMKEGGLCHRPVFMFRQLKPKLYMLT